jgi:4'-phosphopantetheinyl transferase
MEIDLPGAPSVWTVPLDLDPDARSAAEAILSPDEHRRAGRFHFARDGRRFIAARAALRIVLGRRLGREPSIIGFRYGAHGKPHIDDGDRGLVHFNLSHSEDLALIAVAQCREVGVDLEFIRPIPDLERMATHVFSPHERRLMLNVATDALSSFYHHWTIKEAWLKGSGDGLSGPLTAVEVRHGPDGAPRIHHLHEHGADVLPWRFVSWSPAPGFQAALAVGSP